MALISLRDETVINTAEIEHATLSKQGADIGAELAGVRSADPEALKVPLDVLIIHFQDGSALSVRGDEAEYVFEQLAKAQQKEHLDFPLVRKNAG